MVLLLLLLLLPATTGLAQINTALYQSPLQTIYNAIVPNLLQTDVGVGTGAIVLRGAAGCDTIAAWNVTVSAAEKGTGGGGGGVVNVGY
jgi:hypothetical protein